MSSSANSLHSYTSEGSMPNTSSPVSPTCIAACHPDMRTVCRNRKFPLHLRLQFAIPKRKRSRMCSGICHIFFRKIRHCFLQLVMFQCHDILCVINPFDLWDIGVIFSCSRTDRNLDIIRAARSACRRVVHILRLKCRCRGSRRSLTEQGVALSFQIGNTKACPCRHHSQLFWFLNPPALPAPDWLHAVCPPSSHCTSWTA